MSQLNMSFTELLSHRAPVERVLQLIEDGQRAVCVCDGVLDIMTVEHIDLGEYVLPQAAYEDSFAASNYPDMDDLIL